MPNRFASSSRRADWRRPLSALAVALGLAPAGAALAQGPQSIAPGAAPQAWIDYAGLVSQQVLARVASDDPLALRFREYIKQIPGSDPASGVTLTISVWIDAKGEITRVDFPLFAQAQPNDDLKALVVGYTLPQAPPKGMLLPLRLAIHVEPADEPPTKPQAWTDRHVQPIGQTIAIRFTHRMGLVIPPRV